MSCIYLELSWVIYIYVSDPAFLCRKRPVTYVQQVHIGRLHLHGIQIDTWVVTNSNTFEL